MHNIFTYIYYTCVYVVINDIQVPGCFAFTPLKDFHVKKVQVDEITSLLESKQSKENYKYSIKNYDSMEHGFAVRGNLTDPSVAVNRLDCFQYNIAFIKDVLGLGVEVEAGAGADAADGAGPSEG